MNASPPEVAAVTQVLFTPVMLLFRTSGLCATAPLMGIKGVPPQVRLVLSLCLTVWLCSAAPAVPHPPRLEVWWLLALWETALGLLTGLSARLAMDAAVATGHVLASATGLSMGATLDPMNGAESSALATLVSMTALGVALALGVHHQWMVWLWQSALAHPPGATASLMEAARCALESAVLGIPLGVQLAAPALVASTASQLLLGVMGRTAAQLSLSTLGMMASVLGGGAVVAATLGSVLQRLAQHALRAGALPMP